jgi:hypothetical protein
LRKALFDPWQMQATAQRLTRLGVKVEEFPQSPANLTTASQNLYELIQGQGLVVYPDADLRLAISRAVAIETPRGGASARTSRRTRSTSSSPWRWLRTPPFRVRTSIPTIFGRAALIGMTPTSRSICR